MTAAEVRAYNAGVAAVIALARATSGRLALRLTEKPTRFNFAVGALDSLAEEGAALMVAAGTEWMLSEPAASR